MDLRTFFSVDFLMSFVTLANILAAVGGLCTVASMSMKTVIPLRIAGIAGAFFSMFRVLRAHISLNLPVFHVAAAELVPSLSNDRAHQESPRAASADLSDGLVAAFHDQAKIQEGVRLSFAGDHADEIFSPQKSTIIEFNIELRPGHIFGEWGFSSGSPDRIH
jgi:hypothetical protein